MIIKAFQVKNVSINNYNIFLLYGENEGFKNQVIDNISKDYKPNILKYEEDELIKNSDIFFSEVNNISLFDNKKIIIINRVSDKLLSLIESVLEKKFDDLKIIINAGILDRKSKLRAKFEKSKNLICIPFYADDNSTLGRIANNFFRDKKIPISQESINLIVERCRGDRENINNELSKIESFIKYRKKISVDEILKITNLSENYSYSDLSDHCLNKNLKKTMNILNENNYTSEDCIAIIRTMLSKVKRLETLKKNNIDNSDLDSVIANFRPPIFWKDKELVKSQMKIWSLNNIRKLMYLLNEKELLIKKQSQNAINILYDFILSQAKTNS